MLIFLLALQFEAANVAPPTAVDHRVVMAYERGGGRITIRRSGDRLREDDEDRESNYAVTTYTDLGTGLTVSLERGNSGQTLSVLYRGDPRGFTPERRLPPTARRDSALGESCVVSRLVDDAHDGRYGTELCETADGIPLWTARWYAGRPEASMEARTRSLQRRPIRPEELRLPDLAAAAAPILRAARNAPRAADYEVRFMPDSPYGRATFVRRHGGLFLSESDEGQGVRQVVLSNDAGAISYYVDAEGRPYSLTIRTTPSEPERWRPWPQYPAEQVLGEHCNWYVAETTGLDGYLECHTTDGVPLRTKILAHYGESLTTTATSVSRRPLTDAEVATLPGLFDWATWGVTPAP
jgi:hypothetical protein